MKFHRTVQFKMVKLLFLPLLLSPLAWAFNPPEDTSGPLSVRIEGPSKVQDRTSNAAVMVGNAGQEPLQGVLKLEVVDDWRVEPGEFQFTLAPQSKQRFECTLTAGPKTWNAQYPLHARVHASAGTSNLAAHAILIFSTELPDPPKPERAAPWQFLVVPQDSAYALWRAPVFRAIFQAFNETAPIVQPAGWQGMEGRTRAWTTLDESADRGGTRHVVSVHPPWADGLTGTAILEFPLQLPQQRPVLLHFANAIRSNDVSRGEPASDGVTCRVRVLPQDAPDGALGEIRFERHTDAKTWEAAEVNLSHFAGQRIRLQLETHPGPKNDTTCDQAFWAEPTLICGNPPAVTPLDKPAGDPKILGNLADGTCVRAWPGERGLLDTVIGLVGPQRALYFRGFRIRVDGDQLEDRSSSTAFGGIGAARPRHKGYAVSHHFDGVNGSFNLAGEIWLDGQAIRAEFRIENAPAPKPWSVIYLEDVALGPWSSGLTRVYAGTGNVIENPEAFSLVCDGHQFASSFVGFEFENGLSMVEAVNTPPQRLEVAPRDNLFSLHASHAQTITLVPSEDLWAGVRAWRDLDNRSAAGGVPELAGRFVFDLWGGAYAASSDALKQSFRYGLTDALVVWHNWQRWGYDYRLPDIYPPNPDLGSLDDFRQLIQTCAGQGVLIAPHDNYIDLYPDADGFTYRNVAFTQGRQPLRAWLNEGRGAQSYRWRPDALRPCVEHNIGLIKENLNPTAYFIDVWSSIRPYDYWTDDGQFHTCLETRKTWGESFAWIRSQLGNNAPQISESGHDQLIGWLDGGQCNHLRVDSDPENKSTGFTWRVQGKDAERIPWLDMAYHDRFILHGAGYSSRYQGGLSHRMHGIYSDDYIATEVLTGHPAMVEEAFSRNVVRKYWLLHDLMRALARKRMNHVEFDAGNLHRQHVDWENGAQVWVNRSEQSWSIAGHELPPYGFYAFQPGNPCTEAAIETRDGEIVEWASSAAGMYVNPRIEPSVSVTADAARISGRDIELPLHWRTTAPLDTDWHIYVHFVDASNKITFQADHDPEPPCSRWIAPVDTLARAHLPETAQAGQCFEVRTGLWHEGSGRYVCLDGMDDGQQGVRLGMLSCVEGANGGIEMQWTPSPPIPETERWSRRIRSSATPADFGWMRATGACRVAPEANNLLITPLPSSAAISVTLDWSKNPWPIRKPSTGELLDASGNASSSAPLAWSGETVTITLAPGTFACRLH